MLRILFYFRFFHHFKDAVGDTIIHSPPADSAKQEEELKNKRDQMEAEYKKRAKKCTKCGDPLSGTTPSPNISFFGYYCGVQFPLGTAIEALGTTWHQKCFVCFACDKPFQENKFINVDSKPYW